MMKTKRLAGLSFGLLLGCSTWALGWWPTGHFILTEGAVQALPTSLPAFFREGSATIAYGSMDPDVFKNPATPQLSDTEYSEHYIDLELLGENQLPGKRYEFLKLIFGQNREPRQVGLLPYAVMEWTQRLTIAFAEYRQSPENPALRQKCLVYAGLLAHYAEDLCMPLHTTIHHDGRTLPDGKSPKSGIHAKVDALIEAVGLTPAELRKDQPIVPLKSFWSGVIEELAHSHVLVDETYRLEPMLPMTKGLVVVTPPVKSFALERGRAASRFVAQLYLTAWEQSAQVQLSEWGKKEPPIPTSVPAGK